MMDVVTIIGVVAAYALVFMAAVCLFAEKGIHPFRRLRRKFAQLPLFAKLLVLVFGATLFVHGSLKSPTNDPPRSVPAAQQISQADVERGAVLAGMSANVQPTAFDSQLHPGAATNIPWLLRGAHEDWFAAENGGKKPDWREMERIVSKRVQEKSAELADYKRVRKVVVSHEPLERTSIGKVRRVTYKGKLDE